MVLSLYEHLMSQDYRNERLLFIRFAQKTHISKFYFISIKKNKFINTYNLDYKIKYSTQ